MRHHLDYTYLLQLLLLNTPVTGELPKILTNWFIIQTRPTIPVP